MMTTKEIKEAILSGDSTGGGSRLPYEYLPQLAESKSFTDDDWVSWSRAGTDSLEHRLGHLDSALRGALSSPPDARPVKNRDKRADAIQKQIEALTQALHTLEQDEAFSWSFAMSRHCETAVSRIALKYPLAEWKRSIPPTPHLGQGWRHGVHASIESMPILLDTLGEVVEDWKSRGGWPIRAKRGEGSNRVYFVKSLCFSFRRRYKRPLRNFVASLAAEFFPTLGLLTERQVQRIEMGS